MVIPVEGFWFNLPMAKYDKQTGEKKYASAFPLSGQHVELHQAFVDVLLDDADVDERFALIGMAEDPLQGHNVAGHFIIVIAEGLPERMAADALLDARLLCDPVHDLVHALARHRARFVHLPLFAGLEDIFLPLPALQKPVNFPPGLRIDENPRLLPGLFRLDLRIILPPQVADAKARKIRHAQRRVEADEQDELPAHIPAPLPPVMLPGDFKAPLQDIQIPDGLHHFHCILTPHAPLRFAEKKASPL